MRRAGAPVDLENVPARFGADCIIIGGITPHPVPLPRKLALASLPLWNARIRKRMRMRMGEGTVLQPLCKRPFSHGEKDRMRGESLDP